MYTSSVTQWRKRLEELESKGYGDAPLVLPYRDYMIFNEKDKEKFTTVEGAEIIIWNVFRNGSEKEEIAILISEYITNYPATGLRRQRR